MKPNEIAACCDSAATSGCLSATASASFSMASPGFETVSGPLVGAPRCWTTCASSCAISLSPSEVFGLYWSLAKYTSLPVANAFADTA